MAAEPNIPREWGIAAGDFVRTIMDGHEPMGSWSGLPHWIGAPLSGALWGAGLGAAYSGYKYLRGDEPERHVPWWKKPWVVGSGLGLAAGALTKASREKRAFGPDALRTIIMSNPKIHEFEKQRLLQAVDKANPMERQRLMAAAMAGTLTAAVANTVLGLPFWSSAALGGAAGFAFKNLLPR